MGLLSRTKGKVFERKVANVLRAKWPGIEVRRSSQADRAVQSDIYVANGNAKLERIWWELTSSKQPSPETKLEQAERDVSSSCALTRLPVVVWHRYGERTSYATTRLWVLDAVRGVTSPVRSEAVTMPLDQFLDVLSGGVR